MEEEAAEAPPPPAPHTAAPGAAGASATSASAPAGAPPEHAHHAGRPPLPEHSYQGGSVADDVIPPLPTDQP